MTTSSEATVEPLISYVPPAINYVPPALWQAIMLNYLAPRDITSLYEVNRYFNGLFTDKALLTQELNQLRKRGRYELFVGNEHEFLLFYRQSKTHLFALGKNESGQLATGDEKNKNRFTRIMLPKELVRIDGMQAGNSRTVIWGKDPNGNPLVATAGSNCNGQLATGDNEDKNYLTPVILPPEITHINEIKIKGQYTVIWGYGKKNHPFIATAGHNKDDQLITGNNNDHKNQFTLAEFPEKMTYVDGIQVATGNTLIWGRDKENNPLLATAGNNPYSLLGMGDKVRRNCFTLAELPYNLTRISGAKMGGSCAIIWGYDLTNQLIMVAVGSNNHGQLATGNTEEKDHFTLVKLPSELLHIDDLQFGSCHTVIRGYGQDRRPLIATAGFNDCGQLATGDTEVRYYFTLINVPPEIASIDGIQVENSYTVIWGHGLNKQLLIAVAGENDSGELATGDYANKSKLTLIPFPAEIIRIDRLQIKSKSTIIWGSGENGWLRIALAGKDGFLLDPYIDSPVNEFRFTFFFLQVLSHPAMRVLAVALLTTGLTMLGIGFLSMSGIIGEINKERETALLGSGTTCTIFGLGLLSSSFFAKPKPTVNHPSSALPEQRLQN